MYKKIVTWPNKALSKTCVPIVLELEDSHQLLDDLKDTFRVLQGYGLAAPQIGHSVNAFVVNPQLLEIDGYEEEVLEVLNPSISCSGELVQVKEACFSIPEISAYVPRYEKCVLTFCDREGNLEKLNLSGYPAACVQHEFDHLMGHVFLSRLSRLKRSMLIKKVKKTRKRDREIAALVKEQFEKDSALYGDKSSKLSAQKTRRSRKKKTRKQRSKRK
tara:strand:- start:749 stop:1399 length:651 start_codon:yes stop_codon:yes gene_type:complete